MIAAVAGVFAFMAALIAFTISSSYAIMRLNWLVRGKHDLSGYRPVPFIGPHSVLDGLQAMEFVYSGRCGDDAEVQAIRRHLKTVTIIVFFFSEVVSLGALTAMTLTRALTEYPHP